MSEFREDSAITRNQFMKFAAVAAGGLLLPSWINSSVARANESNPSSSEQFEATPSWQQNFAKMQDGQPSSKYWNYVTGNTVPSYNDEAETYTSSSKNVRIQDGLLVIEANLDNGHYTSGEIDTQGKFDFLYGKLEATLKLPAGIGAWPGSIWLLPNKPRYNPANYGLKGAAANWEINGEIDIAEAIGAAPGFVYPSVHTAATLSQESTNNDPTHIVVPDDTTSFHTYGVEKLPESITFTFDGKPYHTVTKQSNSPKDWPFDQNYYIIVNLAMGGTWGGIDKKKYPPNGIDNSKAPWELEFSSISYYDLAKS